MMGAKPSRAVRVRVGSREPADGFAAQARPLAETFAANKDAERPVNAAVAPLFAGKPPANLADVAVAYGRLFKEVEEEWQALEHDAAAREAEPPAALPDAAREEVRQTVFAPGAARVEDLIARHAMGERNRVYDLANYVVGTGPSGLVLAADGSLDFEKSA